MAPEVLPVAAGGKAERQTDKSDMYSFGVVCLFAFSKAARENPNVVVHALKQRGQHNMPIKGIKSTNSTNDANSTNGINGTNNCVPFGGRYSANIILFNQNHKITRFTRNQEIIKYEYKLGRP